MNKIINAKQHVLLQRADDVKDSYVDPKVNDKFAEQADLTNGSDELGYAKVCRGKKHNYLGITLDYLTRGAFKVNMTDCIDAAKEDFHYEANKTLKAQNNKLFLVDTNSTRLEKEKSDTFYVLTTKCMLLCKRELPNVEPGIGFLSTQTNILTQ